MFDEDGGEALELGELLEQLRGAQDIEGLSILGGEPFHQAEGLSELACQAQSLGFGVMVYTGYTLEALQARADPAVDRLLSATDLLVDGPYVEAKRSARRSWLGSDNQRLHYLSERYRDHLDIRSDGTQSVTITLVGDEMTVSGWPGLADALRPRDVDSSP